MTLLPPTPTPTPVTMLPAGAGDEQLVALWLHGRSPHTQAAYARDVRRLLDRGVPIRALTLADLQAFADELLDLGLAPSSRRRILSAVKSLLTFAHRTGYTAVNVGAALRLPGARDMRAERILTEQQVLRMLALERDPQKHLLLQLLYVSGARVSEICALRWRDVQPVGEAGQIALLGKGEKPRVVALTAPTWQALQAARPADASADTPVFRTRRGRALDRSWVLRIVRAAARRAGLPDGVSPHWLRHAHASHALDRGAPISLVQETLGHANMATTGRYTHARKRESSARYLPI